MSEPDLIDHEVRIRQLEGTLKYYIRKYKENENKFENQYTWIVGTVITSICGLLLHAIKLI